MLRFNALKCEIKMLKISAAEAASFFYPHFLQSRRIVRALVSVSRRSSRPIYLIRSVSLPCDYIIAQNSENVNTFFKIFLFNF